MVVYPLLEKKFIKKNSHRVIVVAHRLNHSLTFYNHQIINVTTSSLFFNGLFWLAWSVNLPLGLVAEWPLADRCRLLTILDVSVTGQQSCQVGNFIARIC